MKGSDAVAEVLRREGVEFLACYPNQPLIEACAKAGIRPILCRQERVGMAIADGFSRTNNGKKIGVFSMQGGPGTENAFPGAAQAFSDNVPILIIPTGNATDRSFIPPNFNAVENYRHVTKWRAEISHAERIPELMRRAFYHLRTGKGGPVLLEVPRNVWTADIDRIDYAPVKGSRIAPDPADVAAVAAVLLKAENLVIHAGQGVMYAEATDQLVKLAELLQAPVMTTLPGKSAFPENHPLALGASAVSTTKAVSHFLLKSDVIFGIGTSFTRTPYGKTLPDGKIMVHSTVDPADIHKDYKCDHPLIGDAKLVLAALIEEIGRRSVGKGGRHNREIVEEVRRVKRGWLDEWMPQLTSNEVPINQYRVIWDLMHAVDRDNVILTHDAGSPRDQIVPFWESTVPRSYMGWGKSTQLGYGLGLTMGAKLARPDKLCINIMGDAAIGMTGMDIETAVRYRIGILTIVFNNGVMAIEKKTMPTANERFNAYVEGGDYRTVAAGLGAWSTRVEKPDAFLPALEEAIAATKTGRPALIDVIVKEGYDFSKHP
jgi:acetolactate synthase-1/2/3 large subunit